MERNTDLGLKDHHEIFMFNQNENKEKISIYKNLLILSIAFMLLFTSFTSLQNLQSSLNAQDGIGTISLSILYAAFILSSLFLPPFIIGRFGCKYTLCFSVLTECTYIAANFKSEWYHFTLPISAISVGLGSAPQWAAQGTYINIIGKQFAGLTNETLSNVISRFFGIFIFFYALGQIWGNLISSAVLDREKNDINKTINDLQTCGKDYCPSLFSTNHFNHTTLYRPPDHQVYLLCGIYLAIDLSAGVLMFLFLDNLIEPSQTKTKLSLSVLTKTIKHISEPMQSLLIPMSCYVGMEMAFMAAEFTEAFVTCSWGIDKIGLVMMSYGVLNCISSIIFGALKKFVGRIVIFFFAIIIHFSMLLTMLMWTPAPERTYVFFIIASFWGIADAIWETQCLALYGSLFRDNQEAAFSNKCLWESVGFAITFGYSSYLCTSVKIYILLVFISIAAILYCFVEFLQRQRKTKLDP